MVLVPSYGELWSDGDALRTRLEDLELSHEIVLRFVDDVRAWQTSSLAVVADRHPLRSMDFQAEAGPIQLPLRSWMPRAGWYIRLDASLRDWLHLIDWMRLLAGDEEWRRQN